MEALRPATDRRRTDSGETLAGSPVPVHRCERTRTLPGRGRTDFQVRLGEELRKARTEQGMTVEEVSQALNGTVGAAALRTYERGTRSVGLIPFLQLAALLNLQLSEVQAMLSDWPERGSTPLQLRSPALSGIRLNAQAVRDASSDPWAPLTQYLNHIDPARSLDTFVLAAGQQKNLAAQLRTTPEVLLHQMSHDRLLD